MSDFVSSYESGDETVDESGSESIEIDESGSEVDIESAEEAYIDIESGESNDIEVEIPSGSEEDHEINIADETEKDTAVNIGDEDLGKAGDVNIEDENASKTSEVNIDETAMDKSGEENTDKEGKDKSDESNQNGKEELKEYLEKESPYSPEVNKYISSSEELQVYKDAGLVEKAVDGRTCLIREDLDLDYVDKQSGLTNAELIAKGRSPYDAKTGERIELHHIGQDFNAPLAELKSVSEHDLYSKTLHKSEVDSWRRDPEKVSQYSAQRQAHWKSRA